MKSWFKRRLTLFFLALIASTSGLTFYIIISYNKQIQKYDSLVSAITKANNIHVEAHQIVESEFYSALSNQEDSLVITNLLNRVSYIKNEFNLLKRTANKENEVMYIESISHMIDSFIEKCLFATDPKHTMKEKLVSYQEANTIFILLSKNMSEFISLQIKNRELTLKQLKSATHGIRLFFLGLTAFLLLFSLLYGVLYARKMSESMHMALEKQKHQLLKDYTENLEKRVEERTLELKMRNKELEQFAYVASHDLQEPLKKIIAFGNRIQTLKHSHISDQASDYLQRMIRSANRMKELIEGLLQFARLNTTVKDFEEVNLKEILNLVLADLELVIQEKKAVIQVGDLPTIQANSLQMRQLFSNFITNALKYQRPDVSPIIQVNAVLKNEPFSKGYIPYCELSISDNGIGIEKEYFESIFNIFERAHNRSEYTGTGIGLALCKKIVLQHNGYYSVKSTVNQGTTFTVTLPLHHTETATLSKPAFIS